jgi:uncharacterized membrane protein
MRHYVRRVFITGLLASIPLVVTLALLSWVFTKLDRISPALTQALIVLGLPLPPGYRIPGLGLLVTIILVFLIGLFTTTFVGRRIVDWGECILEKIPLVRTIYGGVKQVVESVASQQTTTFRQVVMVEYPRQGLYSLGFITCASKGEVQDADERHLINVFIPTTPNPTSGMLIILPQEDIIYLSMTVEEGIKLIMSGGILAPKEHLSVPQEKALSEARDVPEAQTQKARSPEG